MVVRGLVVVVATACAAGCAVRSAPVLPRQAAVTPPREWSTQVPLQGGRLTLHLASRAAARDRALPLVLYASGDGGWFGAAVGMYRAMAGAGFPIVGFSSRAFMKIEQHAGAAVTAARIADDYRGILGAARDALALPPETPTLLTGWSRGASLGVLVAAAPSVDRGVSGVVAIGLPRDERLDIEPTDDEDPDPGLPAAPAPVPARASGPHAIEMYPLIAQVAPRRCAVVQASKDKYLTAADARQLLGPDSDVARLFTVEAKNHRFGGGEAAFAGALLEALAWAGRAGAEAPQP